MKDTIDVILYFKQKWEKRSTVVIGNVLCSIFLLWKINSYINWSGKTLNEIIPDWIPIRNYFIPIILIACVFSFIWLFTRRIPKAKKNEIGIALAIKTGNKKVKIKVKNAFIDSISYDLQKYGKFKIIILSEYHTEKILNNNDLIKKYHYKTNCNLLVFGYSEIRTHCGEEHYSIHLDAGLIHSPIPIQESRQLSREMRFVLPQEQLIPFTNEYLGFKFSTVLFGVVARYILGISAFYSRKFESAINLHRIILDETIALSRETNDFPIYTKIRDNSKNFVIREGLILAGYYYKAKPDLDKMKYYLDLVKQLAPDDYNYHILRGIWFFLNNRDIQSAMEETNLASKNKNDYTWAYNKAFLYAYTGDLAAAYKLYESAFYHYCDATIHLQTEEFMRDVLVLEPDKYQLLYCIGLINYKKKEDKILAKEAFLLFIEKAKERNEYTEHITWAEKYLKRCT
jgi:hypothetical protein